MKEPVGLSRQDGKRPDGLTLIPFEAGKPLIWDVTVVCPTADSYLELAAQGPGAVAEMAASRKDAKYVNLQNHYVFQPVAVESLGPINESACRFLDDLGRRISFRSGDVRERQFLYQRISVVIQRFNSVLLHNSFVFDEHSDC